MYKSIILIMMLFPFLVLSKDINSPGLANKIYVTAPIANGGAGAGKNGDHKVPPLKTAGRSLSQIMNEPYSKSYTGLTLQEEQSILSHIDSTKIQRVENDSLWSAILHAYVRNYKKLFREKKSNVISTD